MRKFLLICTTLFTLSYMSAQVNTYNVGDTVNNFTVIDTHGVEHTLYDITATGKYVFLDFFFRDCGPCQATSRYFYELYETYGSNQEHTYMLSLSPFDDNATITEFENLYNGGFSPPPGAGTEGNAPAVITDFGINAYPTYCIIGPDNTLLVGDIWPVTGMSTFEDHFPQGLLALLSVHDVDFSNTVSLYPTVSKGNFNITLAEAGKTEIGVYDLSGKKVFGSSYSTKNIELNLSLANGIYLVRVDSDGKSAVKKIVIKN